MIEDDAILEPEKLLKACNIGDEHNVADFGCGPGIFSIPIARMTEGTVYCFDVLESALEAVNSRAQIIGLSNIVTRRVNLEKKGGSGLDDESINHVIMRKILLQNDDKDVLFGEANRILSSDGKLLIVGWTEVAVKGFGIENRIDEDNVKQFAKDAGFNTHEALNAGQYHYAFIFTK